MKRNPRPLMGLVFVLVVVLSLGACAEGAKRLRPSGVQGVLGDDGALPFGSYIERQRAAIRAARTDLDGPYGASVVDWNAPFELRPAEGPAVRGPSGRYRRAILLTHGLSDSPYMMRAVGSFLQSRGFLVRAVLLPGHGTVPGDLLRVDRLDWIKTVEYGLGTIRQEAEEVYLGGFSTGGALSFLLALREPDIRGLVLFSPAFAVKDRRAPLAGVARLFKDWVGGPRADLNPVKYESFAVNGAYQIYLLTRDIEEEIDAGKRVRAPVFVAASAQDATVDTGRTMAVLSRAALSPAGVFIVYTKDVPACRRLADPRVVCVNSRLEDRSVLDFSHTSLTIPPGDGLLGERGLWRDCLHYGDDPERLKACLTQDGINLGEISEENLKTGVVRRLGFNPLFDDMLGRLDRFLSR
ncbi:MAG TPA: alpha/beta fold hydrolase [Syntrophales bacterium]|nr:alpha/beta fold hydrolase [Syntrophales bacterium]HOM07921.1 alpha/beta fold hydrolase [Syntrophales bacterium]HOO00351.1 alpha/beta fold hydrolase [Syntrophales bacterium]HPQ06629.1 alpha/beta fold hydrolase [Syntrophales bacterium]HRS87692.1 alpha/beta fold hydrolase [Syntrophales bacterium]